MILGYLGPTGTHSQRAAETYARRLQDRDGVFATLIAAPSIPALFHALTGSDTPKIHAPLTLPACDRIVAPLENSHEGVVHTSMDLLVSSNCYIQEEVILQIQHHLLAAPGTSLTAVTDIASHPQAIAQCSVFLQTYFPTAKIHVTESTAAAAQRVSEEKSPHWAAIGSIALTGMYTLVPIAENIHDSPHNQTRFVVLAASIAPPTGHDKTSIVFSIVKDKPGGLHQILTAFAIRNINLTHIASRPSKTVLGEYRFFVDCEGHSEDSAVRDALHSIQSVCSLFKLLGSYRKDTGL